MIGTFIVIEGTDGAGKATQTELLVKRLQAQGKEVFVADFPRYNQFYGKLIGSYLKGEFGDVGDVNPYLASLPYALDRLEFKKDLIQALSEGKIVIANRYVQSNAAFQGAKIEDLSERQKFLDWLTEMEYGINKMPPADLVLFLDVTAEIGQENVEKKGHREYLEREGGDIHETNKPFLEKVYALYREWAKTSDNWRYVDCVENNVMKSKEVIAENIWCTIKEKIEE